MVSKVVRDSTTGRPDWRTRAKRGVKRPRPRALETELTAEGVGNSAWEAHESSISARRRCEVSSDASDVRHQARVSAGSRHAQIERLASHSQVARWLRERIALAPSGPAAAERMQAIMELCLDVSPKRGFCDKKCQSVRGLHMTHSSNLKYVLPLRM